MENLLEYINQRIKETNKNLTFYKNEINKLHRVGKPNWVKSHTNRYLYYHGLLGELAILN